MIAQWNAVTTLDRMLDDVMGSAFGTATNPRTFSPAVDVRTSDTELTLVCDVPGVEAKDLEVTLVDHVLTLKGTRRYQGNENERVVLGRAYGTFTRTFTLPDSIDDGALAAELRDGVLTVKIPKQPKAQPRKITIETHAPRKQLEE